MLRDECILVNEQDQVVGHANKHSCHRFECPAQPKGLLHRAFSVFLFSPDGRLLLQQRARDKITFPGVWTNTCCSHPLFGQQPDEVDPPAATADGSVPGAKHAAVRKLQHELGIPPAQLPIEGFHYLTRLHYCAADTDTWGPEAEWGEHEVDYVLFVRCGVMQVLCSSAPPNSAVPLGLARQWSLHVHAFLMRELTARTLLLHMIAFAV